MSEHEKRETPGLYDWVTTEMFEEELEELIHRDTHNLLTIPGVYEVVAEHYNNEVLERLAAEHSEEFLEASWKVFVYSFRDKILQPTIRFGEWIVADTSEGDVVYPADLFTQESVFEIHKEEITRGDIQLIEGWGACLDAPGYIDKTEWIFCDSEEEAKTHLMETYANE